MARAPVHVNTHPVASEVEVLLDDLDAADERGPKFRSRRRYERLKYRRGPLEVELHHPGGSVTTVKVHTRNLSGGGLCFVAAGFVHPGTKCTIRLTSVMKKVVTLKGAIRWCCHASGRFHQAGATFLTPIDPRQYVGAAGGAQVAPARVLYVNSEVLDRELMEMTLRNAPMQLQVVAGARDAILALSRSLYDVVIADVILPDFSGIELARRLRAGGFRGPLLLLSVDVSPALLDAALEAGADCVVRQPYDADGLLLRISHEIRTRNMPTGDAPIYSEVEVVHALSDRVLSYVRAAHKKLADLERAIRDDDVALASAACRALLTTGVGFGFPIVTECATLALWTINECGSVSDARDELRRLAHVVGRLSVRSTPEDDVPVRGANNPRRGRGRGATGHACGMNDDDIDL
jgi:DNA-binding response OmpR family regulator